MPQESSPYITEELLVLETNVDDLPPFHFERIFEVFLEAGALDVFIQPIQMKKNRPAHLISVLILPNALELCLGLFFKHTSTLGVRTLPLTRYSLPRSLVKFPTRFGEVQFKQSHFSYLKLTPEYEDCKAIAKRQNLPLSKVIEQVMIDVAEQL